MKLVNDRILEAQVATEVMGWHLVEGTTWRDAEGKYRGMTYIWCPSISIADAWDVVEKMATSGDYWFHLRFDGGRWSAIFLDLSDKAKFGDKMIPCTASVAATAPEVICRAALAALEK